MFTWKSLKGRKPYKPNDKDLKVRLDKVDKQLDKTLESQKSALLIKDFEEKTGIPYSELTTDEIMQINL